ncbi:MAG: ABC transporter C-terminal domain-containing protein, partial [Bacillota bacterium]|nr:ABC transporter C-terminal domain-containing protein [Bacillota bacterium]
LLDFNGNYDLFIDYKTKLKKSNADNTQEVNVSKAKLDYRAEKEEKARIRKLEKQYAEVENKISETENRLKEIDVEMCDMSIASDHTKLSELLNEQTSLNKLLEELYIQWESISSELGV